jgi:hypothetical protein
MPFGGKNMKRGMKRGIIKRILKLKRVKYPKEAKKKMDFQPSDTNITSTQ